MPNADYIKTKEADFANQVKRGEADYAPLAFDSTPNYLDTTPLPASPEKWTYKAIFRTGDARVGQWSDEVSITVSA